MDSGGNGRKGEKLFQGGGETSPPARKTKNKERQEIEEKRGIVLQDTERSSLSGSIRKRGASGGPTACEKKEEKETVCFEGTWPTYDAPGELEFPEEEGSQTSLGEGD